MKFEKHIFICTNERDENSLRKSCGSCGGLDLRKDLVRMINESNLKGKVRANKSGCLDVCEKGPAMVIYPGGIVLVITVRVRFLDAWILQRIIMIHLQM